MHELLGPNRCAIYTLIKQHEDPVHHGIDPDDYQQVHDSVWYALTYVRDMLRAFLVANDMIGTDLGERPVRDETTIPDHIATKYKQSCNCTTNMTRT